MNTGLAGLRAPKESDPECMDWVIRLRRSSICAATHGLLSDDESQDVVNDRGARPG